jgi:hypothetical protein
MLLSDRFSIKIVFVSPTQNMICYNNIIILLAAFVFVNVVLAETDICCMPRGHRVNVRDSSVSLSNCTARGCVTSNIIMSYIHYPDLDNYRYRIDFKAEPYGTGPFFEGTTLGFITDKTSLLGFEFTYDDERCACKRTTKPSGIYHITCVTDALQFIDNVSIGVGFEAQLYASNSTTAAGLNTIQATHNFIAQNFSNGKDNAPLCALVHEDIVRRETVESTSQLVALSTRTVEIYNFTPHASDNDYVIPAHCPRSC